MSRRIVPIAIVLACVAGKLSAQSDSTTTPFRESIRLWMTEAPSVDEADDRQSNDRRDAGGSFDDGQDRDGLDPGVVSRGRAAFENACTQCHDADRSLQKRKTLSGWLGTVRRMSRMDDADIDDSDIVPIATYLTSLNPASSNGATGGSSEMSTAAALVEQASSSTNLSATISTLARGGNDNLENPDFFVDAWVRADFQPTGPLRGRVTACTSCHSDNQDGGGFTVEIVEATAHYDLLHHWKEHGHHHLEGTEAEIMGGRFVVPFGAFAAMSHPGIYRTVTNPLMFNMGRQVNPVRTRQPVIPMPYADEGFDLNAKIPLTCNVNATLDVYAVNGLQGGPFGINFTSSRSYADNNHEPAVGGRVTVGSNSCRFGGSVMSGRFQDDQTTALGYHLTGADFTARLLDNDVRLYFEYAIRRNDTILPEGIITYGTVSEIEVLLWSDPNISALARYDNLEHRDQSAFTPDRTSIERFTWGFNTTVFAGSLLIINHERWRFSNDDRKTDVFGFRWVATF